jgi:hypothetical protein
MSSKRSVIVALVGLNLFLLAAMVLSSYSLPAAYAQRMGAGINYISVTCEADLDYDVFYLVDLPNRTLHAFIPARTLDGKLQYVGSRDLARDFAGRE